MGDGGDAAPDGLDVENRAEFADRVLGATWTRGAAVKHEHCCIAADARHAPVIVRVGEGQRDVRGVLGTWGVGRIKFGASISRCIFFLSSRSSLRQIWGLCAYCSSAAQPPRFKAGQDNTTRRQRGVGEEAWGRALHFDRDHHIMMTKRGPKKRLYLQNTKLPEAHRIAPLRRSSLYRQQSCERLVLLALVIARKQGYVRAVGSRCSVLRVRGRRLRCLLVDA